MQLRTVAASRYVTPLREGGSLPAIIEADDEGMYVLKFSGAGQGAKALIAELIAGELARALGLPVPELVFVELDIDLARTEPDPEIQQLIRASAGLNIGLDYLPGAVMFDPIVEQPDAELASSIVWFDALVTNVDRTARNTNLLMWHRQLQMIDHGAALYFHHSWTDPLARAQDPFTMIKDHVLLKLASRLAHVDAPLAAKLTPERIAEIVALVPDAWLAGDATPGSYAEQGIERRSAGASTEQEIECSEHTGAGAAAEQDVECSERTSAAAAREVYREYLLRRLQAPRAFVKEAVRARSLVV